MSYRKLAAARLPALADMKHFVNLTNGIEAIPVLAQLGVASYGYVRIQSTLCEQNNMMGLVEALDDNLMMHLALGHTCCLWDLGSRNKKRAIPRAQWYGAGEPPAPRRPPRAPAEPCPAAAAPRPLAPRAPDPAPAAPQSSSGGT